MSTPLPYVIHALESRILLAISYTGGTLREGFDTLIHTGVIIDAVPNVFGEQAPIPGLSGWDVAKIAGTALTGFNHEFRADSGLLNPGRLYSYGSAGSNDRALGSLASGGFTAAFGTEIVNRSGSALTSFSVSFTSEQWRSSTATNNELRFAWGVSGGGIDGTNYLSSIDMIPAATLNAPAKPWVPVNAATNGNDPAFQSVVIATVTGLFVPTGASLFIRWTDTNDAGNDAGIGIDNFSFSNTDLPYPSTRDLVVESVSVGSSSVNIGGSIGISFRIRNVGTVETPPSNSRLRLSVDQVLTLYDYPLAPLDVAIPSIGGGQYYDYSGTVTVPSGTPLGQYFVGVFADAFSVAGQSNVANDAGLSGTLLTATAAPGLALPVITLQPQSLTVNQGATGQFSVVASSGARNGAGDLSYQWFHNGSPILVLDQAKNSSILSFANSTPQQAGDYWVSVANEAGALLSDVATLTVNGLATQLIRFHAAGLLSYGGQSIDTTKPTVIVTHGWQPTGIWPASAPNPVAAAFAQLDIMNDMLPALDHRLNPSGARNCNVLGFVWAGAFTGLLGFPLNADVSAAGAEGAGKVLAALINQTLGPAYAAPLHLIGHSHGAVVNAVAVDALRTTGTGIDVEQVTMLDAPQQARFLPEIIPNVFPGMYDGQFFTDRLLAHDQPYGVEYVENYYGTNLLSVPPGLGSGLRGAAPGAAGAAGDPTAGHRDVWVNYRRSIDDANPANGFDFSVVLGTAGNYDTRPEPRSWGGGATSTATPNVLPSTVSTGNAPGWLGSGNFGNGIVTVGGQTTPALFLRPQTNPSSRAMGESSLLLDVAIPSSATALRFDYLLPSLPADTFIEVAFNDAPLATFSTGQSTPDLWQSAHVPVGLLAGTAGVLTLKLNAPDGSTTEVAFANCRFVDHAAPLVAATYAYETRQALTLTFSESIGHSLTVGDITIRHVPTGQIIPMSEFAFSVADDSRSALLVKSSSILPDGDYVLTVPTGAMLDDAGNELDDDFAFGFSVLGGDANRDRKVDITDLAILATNWQQTGRTFSQGDFNYDSKVDISDLAILATNWQRSLPLLGQAPTPRLLPRRIFESAVRSVFNDKPLTADKIRRPLVEEVELVAVTAGRRE